MLVEQFLENSASLYADKIALICGEDRYTYHQIEEQANRLAHAFIAAGVQRGDRIVISLPNSVESVLAIFAALKAGAVFVVLNPTTKTDKLVYILNNCRASTLVVAGGRRALASPGWARMPHLNSVFAVGATPALASELQSANKAMVSLEYARNHGGSALPPAKKCIDKIGRAHV